MLRSGGEKRDPRDCTILVMRDMLLFEEQMKLFVRIIQR